MSTAVGAVGTVGTLVVAVILWRRDRARDRRRQASLVNGYATPSPQNELPEWGWPVPQSAFVVENNSDGPIRYVHLPDADGSIFQLAVLIKPGSRHEEPIENVDKIERLGLADASVPIVPITFSFTDQEDVRWTRHANKRLEETPDAP